MRLLRLFFIVLLIVSCQSQEQNNPPRKDSGHTDSPARKISHVYIPAEFPGGQDSLRDYFRKNVPCIDSVKLYGEHFVEPLPAELRFKIDTLGRVIDLGIVNATFLSKNKELHDRCLDAIHAMRWHPATNDGKKIVSHVWISFRLRE